MADMNRAAALRRLDMNLLLIFDETARRRKLSAVAEALGLTQSAISHALTRLREIFGDELFLRRPYGVEPTARALELEPQIRAILDLGRAALDHHAPFDPEAAIGRIRICAQDYHCALIAAPLAATFERNSPGLKMAFLPLGREVAIRAIEAGEADLALGYFPQLSDRFEMRELVSQGYAVVARRGHPRSDRLSSIEDYLQERHLLVSQTGDDRGVVDAHLARDGRSREVALTVPYFLAAVATIARTDLVATVPRLLADRFAERFGLVVIDPPVEIRRFSIHAVRHRRDSKNGMIDWVVQQVAVALETKPSVDDAYRLTRDMKA